MELKDFIKERRKQLGLSLQNIADAISYSPQAISKFETGTVNIDLRLVDKLTKILNVSLSCFLNCDLEHIEEYKDYGEFDENKFITTFKYYRDKNKISQIELTKVLSLPKGKISKIENGETFPSISEFIKIANYFKVSYEELYYGIIKEEVKVDNNVVTTKKSKFKNILTISLSSISLILLTISIILGIQIYSFNNPNTIINNYYEITYKYDLTDETRIEHVYSGQYAPNLTYIHKGYELEGYYLDGELFNFDTPITKNITLTGKLNKKIFDVYFYDYFGEEVSYQKIKYQESAIAPTLKHIDNLHFVKWNTDSYLNVEENLSIYPIYNTYNTRVYFDLNGGEFLNSRIKYIDNFHYSDLKTLPKIVKKGHKFNYFTYGEEVFNNETPLKEVMTLKAQYDLNKYTIRFKNNEFEPIFINYGEIVKLPTVSKQNRKILKYISEDFKEYDNEFYFKDDKDLVLSLLYGDTNFNYQINSHDQIIITSIDPKGSNSIKIPLKISNLDVIEISSNALKDNNTIESIYFENIKINIKSGAFNNLNNLKYVDFSNISENSRFESNIFINCPLLNHLRVGAPSHLNEFRPYLLKDYGLVQNNNFILSFGNVENLPINYNTGFGQISTLNIDGGLSYISEETFDNDVNFEYINVLKQIHNLYLKIDDNLKQDKLEFNFYCKLTLDSQQTKPLKTIKAKALELVTTINPILVEELIFDKPDDNSMLYIRSGVKIKSNKVVFCHDNIFYSNNNENNHLLAPLSNKGIDIYFTGMIDIPSVLLNSGWLEDPLNSRIHFN